MTTPLLAGKVALVTGGSRGIGAAIVRRLTQEGAAVAFTYSGSHEAAEALAAHLPGTLAIQADSADPAALQRAVAQVVAAHGRIDILAANAGTITHGLVDQTPLSEFDRIVSVNIRGVFAAIQAVLPHMGAGGRIVTTGSVTAERTGLAGVSLYSMSKAAVAGLVRALAHDLGPRGITIANVQPGPTTTAMAPQDVAGIERLTRMMPIGRLGAPEEIAGFVAYLVGPDSGFINGASLTIDGGYLA